MKKTIGIRLVFLSLTFPVLSVIGAWLLDTNGNNSVSVLLLVLISVYALLVTYYHDKISKNVYPLGILMISLSLLFMYSLRSPYIMGYDLSNEYYVFQLTKEDFHWDISKFNNPYNTILSITILPTMYSEILNIGDGYVFKILYQLVFSLVPLIIYITFAKYTEKWVAFLAAFFFMSNSAFSLQMTSVARQEVAMFFFTLTIFIMLTRKIHGPKGNIMYIIFGAALILSHYYQAYLFLLLLLLTYLIQLCFKRFRIADKEKNITATLVSLFIIVTFLWYGQTTATTFTYTIDWIGEVFKNLNELFIFESRMVSISDAIGFAEYSSIPSLISSFTGIITKCFILFGVIYILLKKEFNFTYRSTLLADFSLTALVSIAPIVLSFYFGNRGYLFLLILLAPSCVIGGMVMFRYMIKDEKHIRILMSVILVTYLLSSTFFISNLFGVQTVTLNNGGYHYDNLYFHEQEISAAKWTRNIDPAAIYTDMFGKLRMIVFNLEPGTLLLPYDPDGQTTPILPNNYVYLRYNNILTGRVILSAKYSMQGVNTTEYFDIENADLIFNNGQVVIYKS